MIRSVWKNLLITRKLYLLIGVVASLIVAELFILCFCLHNLTAVRAFVNGESQWSKAQKNSMLLLQRYAATRNEADYAQIATELRVIDGDRRARRELLSGNPDYKIVREGFLEGKLHPDDIEPMANLLTRFFWVDYVSQAIRLWEEGDDLIDQFRITAARYRTDLLETKNSSGDIQATKDEIELLNIRLTQLGTNFSAALIAGARKLENAVLCTLLGLILSVELCVLCLTYLLGRSIARRLDGLKNYAARIEAHNYEYPLVDDSKDEIGQLANSMNSMASRLDLSHKELEKKIAVRTKELYHVAEQNAHLYEEARDAIKSRDEFLSVATHELKSPISAIHLSLQMLERVIQKNNETPDLEKILAQVQQTIRQSRKLNSMQDKLLDLTRITSGKLMLNRSFDDIMQIVREATEMARGEENSDITIIGPKELCGMVDATRMSQVIVNLVSNAIKYGNGSAVEVKVQNSSSVIKISVADKGPGISPELQDKIFDRFERGSAESSVSGLGLGLYISKQIMEAHGGNLNVISDGKHGATFVVSFPLITQSATETLS